MQFSGDNGYKIIRLGLVVSRAVTKNKLYENSSRLDILISVLFHDNNLKALCFERLNKRPLSCIKCTTESN